DPFDPCERCEWCRAGRSNLCAAGRFAGVNRTHCALRTTMPWPGRLLRALPDEIGTEDAALLEPLGVALHAFDLGEVQAGGRVGVFGCGPIGLLLVPRAPLGGAVGLLLVQRARRAGASVVVATDRLEHRVAAALAAGATDGLVIPDRSQS